MTSPETPPTEPQQAGMAAEMRPVPESARIEAIDAIRGLALLGIFFVNINLFADAFGKFVQHAPPQGAFIVLLRAGAPIAMGAFKRYDGQTAELKRIWTRGDLPKPSSKKRSMRRRSSSITIFLSSTALTCSPHMPRFGSAKAT